MHFLITAGPTREPLDPVRYLTNRSSGRMGYALAESARDEGHEVIFISGPVWLPAPSGITLVKVETARQMFEAVQKHIVHADAAIFAAAVADYRPVMASAQKIKKASDRLTLVLERTEDILGSARKVFDFQGCLVGFAAETEKLVEHAQDKLTRKGCDLVIANDVSQPGIGFDSAENAVTLCLPGGQVESVPQQSKALLAKELIQRITALASARAIARGGSR
jgi:phosphopantothenoylcysteine synthetase/decarboxylase